MNVRKLKALETKMNRFKGEREVLVEQQKEMQYRLKEINNSIKEINKQLQENTKELKVSEHALLRYIERTNLLDVRKIEKEIIEAIEPNWESLLKADGTYPCNGMKCVVKDSLVITMKPQ